MSSKVETVVDYLKQSVWDLFNHLAKYCNITYGVNSIWDYKEPVQLTIRKIFTYLCIQYDKDD